MRNRSLLLVLFAAACGDNLRGASVDGGVDTPPPGPAGTISLVASSSTSETGTLVVTAQRTGGSEGQVSATYGTSDGTATEGADYTAATGTVTWADGDSSDKVFTITLIDDLLLEGAETIELSLTNPTGGATIGDTPAATITDDDVGGNAFVLTSNNRLLSFDRTSPGTIASEVAVTGLPNPTTIIGIDFRPATGELFALSLAGRLYTINTTTGVATAGMMLIPDVTDLTDTFTTLDGTQFGVDFNPVPDRLRVVSNTGQNLRINVMTGAVITDTDLTANIAPSGAAYTNNFAAACRTSLFTIETATDRLLLQSPPNDGVLTSVGGLGVDATAVRGFDTSTATNGVTSAFAVLDVGGASTLFGINTTTGAAISAGAIPLTGVETIRGFALPPPDAATPVTQGLGELIGVTTTTVLSYERGAPAKACTSAPITGLATGDVPVDVDARPSTGEIHVLTNNAGTGKVYTVNPTTGAATGAVTVAVALTGTAFGMDFNPTGVVPLRIVSDAGQNLRVTDLATGATMADGALNGATTVAMGSAYTDSVQGAGTTTLYVVDTSSDQLLIQNPPNAGTTTAVGPLGVNITTLAGFDIDGRDNVAFLGNTTGAATTLHTINLANGTVSASLGTFGGGAPLVGLTRRTPTTTVFAIAGGTSLVRIPLNDPTTVTVVNTVTGLANSETIVGLDFRPSTGLLYGVGSTSRLYRIDTATAAATLESTLSPTIPTSELGVDFNPLTTVPLRIVSTGEDNLRVPDITTGTVVTDTSLTRAARTWSPSAIAYSSNVPGATATTLYALDDTNNRLLALFPPNAGSVREIGALGSSPGASAAFEIIGPDTGVAIFNASATKEFVNINLTTGAATAVGTVNQAGLIVGIAAAPDATPDANATITGVTSLGTLFSFPRNAPGTVTNIGTITGIGLLETVESFDIRPSDGVLYLLTRTTLNVGRLYTVSGTTATFVGDLTTPLGLLVDYSIDFNPTGVVPLRLIGSDGSNARIPTLTGPIIAVTTDTALNVAAPDVAAVAYTNSFRGATATLLFALDLATASIVQIDTPNSGNLVMIGALSATLAPALAGAATFDIAGGNNGLALVTVQNTVTVANVTTTEPFSRLFRVNAFTGQATEIGTGVANAGVQPINGLAIDVR